MTGKKIDLVLVPGLLCTARLWQAQVAALTDIAQIAVTTAQREHDDIGAIADASLAAAPDRFALAGLSFGGYVAFEIMRRAPERVSRLALLDTSARPDPEDRRRQRADQIKLAGTGRFLGVSEQLLARFLHPDRLGDEALVSAVKAMAEEVGRDGFVRQQKAILGRPDSRPTLAAIHCPTLVLVGRQDQAAPLEAHEEMAAAIRGAQLAVIEDCGHLSTMEQPGAVTRALRDWILG